MINLNIMGGMGNQMFQYAFARSLSEVCGDRDIVINPWFLALIRMSASRKALRTAYSLYHFELNECVRIDSGFPGAAKALGSYVYYVYNTFFVHASPELFAERCKKGTYLQTTRDALIKNICTPPIHTDNGKKTVTGYFGSDKWWLPDIGDILRKEFKVKTEPSKENKKMIEKISSCNSVCVHVRRGDYLLPNNAFLNICGESYYRSGMDYIAQHTKDPVFFIFTNNSSDVSWIRENYTFDYPVEYVDLNNPDYEELRLMYCCRHFVICNSSFSWWSSYLSENKEKIVVAPDRWTDSEANMPKHIRSNTADKQTTICREEKQYVRGDMVHMPINFRKTDC